jgi:hypothetical protein
VTNGTVPCSTQKRRRTPAFWLSSGSADKVTKYILLVDDSELIRLATRHFSESQPGFTVCGEAVDGIDALEKAKHLNPDLIILDIAMPRMNVCRPRANFAPECFRSPLFYLPGTRRRSAGRCAGSRDQCRNFQIKFGRPAKSGQNFTRRGVVYARWPSFSRTNLRLSSEFQFDFIHVAPSPVFPRLK